MDTLNNSVYVFTVLCGLRPGRRTEVSRQAGRGALLSRTARTPGVAAANRALAALGGGVAVSALGPDAEVRTAFCLQSLREVQWVSQAGPTL